MPPSGLAAGRTGQCLYVTCSGPTGTVYIIDREVWAGAQDGTKVGAGTAGRNVPSLAVIQAGPGASAPVLSPDEKTLYVCNRSDNSISLIDLERKRETGRIQVQREPVAAAVTPDGKTLLVANHLPQGRADDLFTAAVVSVIDLEAQEVRTDLALPNGSSGLRDLRVSPDGKYAVVSHGISRFLRPASVLRRGWMNLNAITIIDVVQMEVYNTVILDDLDSGAANPWGLAWTADGAKVVVAHSGTHDVSLVDFPLVLEQLPNLSGSTRSARASGPRAFRLQQAEAAETIPFLRASHPRLALPPGDLGPRAVVVIGTAAYTANFFSETLTKIELQGPAHVVESFELGESPAKPATSLDRAERLKRLSLERRGEFYFHDAGICQEGWQSCATCHPGDGRADGLNWDLVNDGTDNPKNTKSLLLAFQTPPAMSLGVRETAQTAVRAGISQILFTKQPEEVALAIDAYIKSLQPVPSPHLVNGQLSPAAERGKKIFTRAGCADCHPPGLFTDLGQYDVGTRRPFDKPKDTFDTPTLVELWRTAPYLHDGSAATVRDVVTTRNPHDEHGKTSDLSPAAIHDLCEYLLSL